jgi:hypothetical protein
MAVLLLFPSPTPFSRACGLYLSIALVGLGAHYPLSLMVWLVTPWACRGLVGDLVLCLAVVRSNTHQGI